jgi:hypothetical protein
VKRFLATLATFTLFFIAHSAQAQSWMMNGEIGAGTGLEGGSPRDGGVSWHRARTRIMGGLDMNVDEDAYQSFGFRAFVELEHTTTLGGSFHYTFWPAKTVGLFAGFTGVVAPETLLGVEAGGTFVIPLGKKLGIFIEPSIAALPLGGDLPKGSVVIWTLLSAGLRFSL